MELLADDSPIEIRRIETSGAPEPFGPEPQALQAGELLFLSTVLPVDSQGQVPDRLLPTPELPYFRLSGRRQLDYMLGNVSAICEVAGSSLEHVCRRQAFYRDLSEFASINEGWAEHFPAGPPASSDMQVGEPGWPLPAPGAQLRDGSDASRPPRPTASRRLVARSRLSKAVR
jgi:enamine deaminase RidA (YjgF/YER057c/UK114 family)